MEMSFCTQIWSKAGFESDAYWVLDNDQDKMVIFTSIMTYRYVNPTD